MKNFEKFKTAEKRLKAFEEWCKNNRTQISGPICKIDMENCFLCQFAWLDLEAEEEKILPCPYCGKECRTVKNRCEAFVVACDMCCYTSQDFEREYEAIAKHNRVARAVMESDKEGDKE